MDRPSGAAATVAEASPSRIDSLLAHGRLRAAEEALYAAVAAAPRAPAARGALARYLASRARFRIAEVLFLETLRFGADTASIAQALMAIAPYHVDMDRRRLPGVRLPAIEAAREAARLNARTSVRTSVRTRVRTEEQRPENGAAAASADTTEVTVPFAIAPVERVLGSFEVRGTGGPLRATLDPSVVGLLVRRADDASLAAQRFGGAGRGEPLLVKELWIGARRLVGVEARVDPDVAPGEVRVGFDLLWALHPVFDEASGTLTIPRVDAPVHAARGATQIPFAIAFPGLWLIPEPGMTPVSIESARGRALLSGARWQLDPVQGTLIVER